MLVLSRKKGESIMIGDQIEVMVLGSEGDTVRIGISAPKSVAVYRKEIHEAIQQSNKEASQSLVDMQSLKEIFKKNDE